jgi:rubrerythrin
MVILLIAILVGVLVVAILIVKATKTSSREIVGMNIICKKCGTRTNGLSCPKCKNKSQSFGV